MPEPKPDVRIYTADEAAVMLRCTVSWLKEQARLGGIGSVLIANKVHFTQAHIDEFLRRNDRPATAAAAPVRTRAARTAEPAARPVPLPPVVQLRAKVPRRMRQEAS
jgi:hypothetical protein